MIPTKHRKRLYSEPFYFIKRPTFLDGLASNYDIYNSRSINLHISPKIDSFCMKSDFDLVGRDLHHAIKTYSDDFSK